jgi:hypothetical protein
MLWAYPWYGLVAEAVTRARRVAASTPAAWTGQTRMITGNAHSTARIAATSAQRRRASGPTTVPPAPIVRLLLVEPMLPTGSVIQSPGSASAGTATYSDVDRPRLWRS